MKVLVVFVHPRRDSFTGAVLDSFLEGLNDAGHEAAVADLYGEGFDPRFGDADFSHFNGLGPIPEEIRDEQRRIESADGLVFIFPVWWWSTPAMLKGWIDRVFTGGWAYDYVDGKSAGLLKDRPVLWLASAAVGPETYAKYGYDKAMKTQIDTGILAFCGLDNVAGRLLYDVGEDRAITDAHLADARLLGREFPSQG